MDVDRPVWMVTMAVTFDDEYTTNHEVMGLYTSLKNATDAINEYKIEVGFLSDEATVIDDYTIEGSHNYSRFVDVENDAVSTIYLNVSFEPIQLDKKF